MLEQFKGREGKPRLAEALAKQELVLRDSALAQRLGKFAKLDEYEQGQEIYVQGEPGKNSLYFVIAGTMDLLVKGKPAAIITAGQAFGEFPILDPGLRYTVTVRAREQSVIARVAETHFRAIAEEYPAVWKNMAEMLMKRLHRTHDLITPARPPCVFIGHGRSQLWKEVRGFLERELSLKTVEYESEPRAGISVVSILEEMLNRATFAVVVLTAEDDTAQGGKRARQNVIHEAGLFQGVLGFRRAILLLQSGVEEFSNVAGLEYIAFEGDAIAATFGKLRGVLRREEQLSAD